MRYEFSAFFLRLKFPEKINFSAACFQCVALVSTGHYGWWFNSFSPNSVKRDLCTSFFLFSLRRLRLNPARLYLLISASPIGPAAVIQERISRAMLAKRPSYQLVDRRECYINSRRSSI